MDARWEGADRFGPPEDLPAVHTPSSDLFTPCRVMVHGQFFAAAMVSFHRGTAVVELETAFPSGTVTTLLLPQTEGPDLALPADMVHCTSQGAHHRCQLSIPGSSSLSRPVVERLIEQALHTASLPTRREPRHPYRAEVRGETEDGAFVSGHSTDLSPSGLGVVLGAALPAETEVFLDLTLPDPMAQRVPVVGKVRHSLATDEPGVFRVGVELAAHAEAAEALARYRRFVERL